MSHDYEITVSATEIHHVLLDVSEDRERIRIREHRTCTGSGRATYYRKIDYYFER